MFKFMLYKKMIKIVLKNEKKIEIYLNNKFFEILSFDEPIARLTKLMIDLICNKK